MKCALTSFGHESHMLYSTEFQDLTGKLKKHYYFIILKHYYCTVSYDFLWINLYDQTLVIFSGKGVIIGVLKSIFL
jgi:hypothetical protein